MACLCLSPSLFSWCVSGCRSAALLPPRIISGLLSLTLSTQLLPGALRPKQAHSNTKAGRSVREASRVNGGKQRRESDKAVEGGSGGW